MKKLLLSILSTFLFTAIAQAEFSDVTESTTYHEAIEYLNAEGIINGYPDGTFKPNNTLNRAELLKILIEATIEEEVSADTYKNCFPDVQVEWFAIYVCYAKEQGIVNGYPDGTFRPADEVNFVEALKMMMKSYNYNYSESDPWYRDIVETASDRKFLPFNITAFDQKLARRQMADMITRALKEESGELERYLRNTEGCNVTYESLQKNQNIAEDCLILITISQSEHPFRHNPEYESRVLYIEKDADCLNLSYEEISSIEGLDQLPNLTTLDLGGNNIRDLSFLENLANLGELDLRRNFAPDLMPLIGMKKLKKLNLGVNRITNKVPLKNLPELQTLWLYNSFRFGSYSDFSVLSEMDNLEEIDVSWSNLSDELILDLKDEYPHLVFREHENDISLVQIYGTGDRIPKINTQMTISFLPEEIDITTEEGMEEAKALISAVSEEIYEDIQESLIFNEDDIAALKMPILGIITDDPQKLPEESKEGNMLYLHWDENIWSEYIIDKLQNAVADVIDGEVMAKRAKAGFDEEGERLSHQMYLLTNKRVWDRGTTTEKQKEREFFQTASDEIYKKLHEEGKILQSDVFRSNVGFLTYSFLTNLGDGEYYFSISTKLAETIDIAPGLEKYSEIQWVEVRYVENDEGDDN